MSKSNGFLQLRRGLWEHVRDGRLSITAALAFIYICSEADTRIGIWKGSAKSLLGELGIPERTARDVLEKLERGDYIRRFAVPGRHLCYPILVHKFAITQGEHNGEQLNAIDSKSPTDLAYFCCEQSVGQDGEHGAAQRRGKNREERKNPAAKPAPPADPCHQPFIDFAYQTFKAKHGQNPVWLGKDFKRLKEMLASAVGLSQRDLQARWENYLASTEPFTVKQGGRLAYFCSNVDGFSAGPIIERKGGTHGKPLATTQPSHSPHTPSKNELINEWLTRFALNADKALGARERGIYLSTWAEGFADVAPDRLKAAFIACLRAHTFKTMPTIGDVRQHLTNAETSAEQFTAEQKWTRVLDYLRCYYSPDLPGSASRGAPRITERTDHAIRAAGGLAWLNECDREQLVWCKKAFIEDYLRWDELDRGQYLLPEGAVKQAFGAIAKLKQLPEGSERAERYRLLAEGAKVVEAELAESGEVSDGSKWRRQQNSCGLRSDRHRPSSSAAVCFAPKMWRRSPASLSRRWRSGEASGREFRF